MQLTDEQINAVNLFKDSQSLKISAFAGTGKTSTLTALANSSRKSGLYLAFNKSVAAEASGKFPQTVACRTTHALALKNIPGIYRQNSRKLFEPVNGNLVAKLLEIEEIAIDDVLLKPRALAYLTARAVQRFCQSGDEELDARHVPITGKMQKLHPKYQDEFRVYVGQLAAHLWRLMRDPSTAAPLGHDGYLKLWSLSKPTLHYDYILLDEAQDTNEAVLSVLRQQQTQLTLVGDRHQQIYEWRGAVNAMASVETGAEALLTRSFRFGEPVALAATSILRLLGESRSVIGDPSKHSRIAAAGRTGTILCRTNAGVVGVVVDALNVSRTVHVVGGVAELMRMLEDVERLKSANPAECPEFFGFANWDELADFAESEEGQSVRSFVKIVNIQGESNLIKMLKVVSKEEAGADLIVSTGHKAKGREWDSVTLFSDFEPRLDKANPEKLVMNQEEARLLYVAVTRARKLLVVPPRLAEKWNVEPTAVMPSDLTSPRLSSKDPIAAPRPALPLFATVVTTNPSAANKKPLHVKSAPKAATRGDDSHLSSAAITENKAPPDGSSKGIFSTIVSFVLGKT